MKWIVDNWSLLVVVVCALVVVGIKAKKFTELPSEEQRNKIKECLLLWVIEAERLYKGGTGAIKLRYVYDKFIEKFPSIAPVVSFIMFSEWVDDVLVYMKHLLETNENINKYVEGE